MFAQNIAILLAISGVYASPIVQRDACSDACSAAYNTCRGQPNANRATCASEYSSCLGYLPFNSEGSLVTPTACSTTAKSTATGDACVSKCNASYNTCRSKPDANRASCAAEYSGCLGYVPFNSEGSLVTPTACSTTVQPTATSDACVTKCNAAYNTCRGKPDANRATCAAEYSSCLGYLPFNSEGSLVTPTACSSATATITAAPTVAAAPAAAPAATGAAQSGWTVKQLIRYCSEDGKGCDYNFAISTNDGAADQRCTIVRTNVSDAPTESWYDVPCTTGSPYRISWGYSTQFATPFAVLTVVNTQAKAQAYFGVNDPTGQAVTPSNPRGSGNFGDIGPQPVYTS